MRLLMAGAFVFLAACAGDGDAPVGERVSIPFDPAAQSASDADAQAHAYCESYGKSADFIDESIDPDGRLRRRHYHCR
jgi:hypothetical protein